MKCVRGNAWPASAVGALKPPPPLMHCGTGPESACFAAKRLGLPQVRQCTYYITNNRTRQPRDRVRGRQPLQPQ